MINDDLPFYEKDEINFFFEDIEFDFQNQQLLIDWIKASIKTEQQQLGQLNFIFCSDNYLHEMNLKFLKHDTLTDIITFPYSDSEIKGDIFISIDRVHENAIIFAHSFEQELNRVMIHGVLHLLGFGDKTEIEKTQMTSKENEYLFLLNGMKLDIK